MHRSPPIFALTAILLACDPAATSTLRLTLSPVIRADTAIARIGVAQDAALAAIRRVVSRFGLTRIPGGLGGCGETWRLSGHLRTDKPRGGGADLVLCVERLGEDGLETHLLEIRGWSPVGDSLRRTVADTLASFGTVQQVRECAGVITTHCT